MANQQQKTQDDIASAPVIFESDKKQKFGISDNGDFIDNLYREQVPSKIFGILIGRNNVEPNNKKIFSTADVVCEGYLYKKGSWMKNWKRRYFVLRRDIRMLCYYDSRESLTLLGSISLDMDTTVTNVKPADADGFSNVVSMLTEYDDNSSVRTLVRFENFDQMKAWMVDIKNEAHKMTLADDGDRDWWAALFDDVVAIEPKSSVAKREAHSGESNFAVARKRDMEDELGGHKNKTSHGGNKHASSASGSHHRHRHKSLPPQAVTEVDPQRKKQLHIPVPPPVAEDAVLADGQISPPSAPPSAPSSAAPTPTQRITKAASEMHIQSGNAPADSDVNADSDEESDPEDRRIASELIASSGRLKADSTAVIDAYRASHGQGQSQTNSQSHSKHAHSQSKSSSRGSSNGVATKLSNKKIKHLKKDGHRPGPPPFSDPTADRFERPDKRGSSGSPSFQGLQFSLRLCNVCSHGDRIFVAMSTNTHESKKPATVNPSAGEAATGNTTITSGSSGGAGSPTAEADASGSKGSEGTEAAAAAAVMSAGGSHSHSRHSTQTLRTEIRTVTEKPVYGENFISEVRLHFSVMEGLLPDNCKDVKFVVYRLENEMSLREPAKASNLNMQFQVAKTVLPKKLLDVKPLLKIAMKVTMERPMDIAVPLFKEAEVFLGIVKMSSPELSAQRSLLTSAMQVKPYSEMVYSFYTHSGQTMSLEQLYASRYSVSVAQALVGIWQNERNDFLVDTLRNLRAEFTAVHNEQEELKQNKHSGSLTPAGAATMLASSAAAHASADSPGASHHSRSHHHHHHHRHHSHARGGSHSGDAANEPSTALTAGVGMGSAPTPPPGDELSSAIEHFRHAIEVLDTLQREMVENAELVLQTCLNMEQARDLVNTVIDAERGGAVLRRSTWKKISAWQYCATNLNLHIMTSRMYTFNELAHSHKTRAASSDATGSSPRTVSVASGASSPNRTISQASSQPQPQSQSTSSGGDAGNSTGSERGGLFNNKKIHCVPTITMGVPAAHELKYQDGGLRRLFLEIPDADQKLKWMHALQAGTLEPLQRMFDAYPREALQLFGVRYTLVTKEDFAFVLKRKAEIAERLDICGSQALAGALTTVRSICTLAAHHGGRYMDILARSLQIGFLVMYQSMLSSQGAEVGMIEDLDIAVLWLSLVTVRLVTKKSVVEKQPQRQQQLEGDASSHKQQRERSVEEVGTLVRSLDLGCENANSSATATKTDQPLFSAAAGRGGDDDANAAAANGASHAGGDRDSHQDSYIPSHCGHGDGVMAHRDLNERLVVDLEVSAEEAAAVAEAQRYMQGFRDEGPQMLRARADAEFAFNRNPQFYEQDAAKHLTVCAVVELFGIAFTQGVNEMQTLANMSSSREVMRQVEINHSAMARLDAFYSSYRRALHHQLNSKTPELLDVLRHAAAIGATPRASMGGDPRLPGTPAAAGAAAAAAAANASSSGTPPLHQQQQQQQKSDASPATPVAGSGGGGGPGGLKRKKSIWIHASVNAGAGGAGADSLFAVDETALAFTVETLKSKVLSSNDRMLDQAKEANAVSSASPYDKHVDVLLKTSALCREMAGIVTILCKSGKDRTSMGATLEITRSLVEELGILESEESCQTMRMQGVRRMNVYANTGQPMFAFNQIQRIALPNCYRPPPGAFSGNVQS